MSKIKLVLPVGNKAVTFSNPFTKEFITFKNLLVITNLLSIGVFSLFIFLLSTMAGILSYTELDTVVLRFLIFFVFALLAIFLVRVVLAGGKIIIDPKGFLMVLLFNLVLTASSVLVVTTRVSNTFGTIGFRYLAGITLISLIGVFYFTSLHTMVNTAVRRFVDLFIFGTEIFVLVQLLSERTSTQTSVIMASLPVLALAILLSAYRLLSEGKIDAVKAIILAVFTGLSILIIPLNIQSYSTLFLFTLALLISYLLVALLYVSRVKLTFKSRVKTALNNFKLKMLSKSDVQVLAVLVVPVVLILALAFFYLNLSNKNIFNPIVQQYSTALQNLNGGAELNTNNLRTLVLGKGSDNYSSNAPFLVNVLIVQGLLGVLIYAVLWTYFINKAKGALLYNLKNRRGFKLTAVILFYLILMPLVLIYSYPSLIAIILMWAAFALVGNLKYKEDQKDLFLTEPQALPQTKNKALLFSVLRVVSVVLITTAAVYLVHFLWTVIK